MPLGQAVFFPGTSKPLNIVEARYIQMVNDSIHTGTPIAIGFVDEPEQAWTYFYGQPPKFIRSIVGYGQATVIEQKIDGSMVIFLHSQGKARLGNILDRETPYIVCEAEKIFEHLNLKPESVKRLVMIQKSLNQWLARHVPDPGQRNQFAQHMQAPLEIVGCYASFMVTDPDLQQLILETDDLNDKIDLIHRLMSSGDGI